MKNARVGIAFIMFFALLGGMLGSPPPAAAAVSCECAIEKSQRVVVQYPEEVCEVRKTVGDVVYDDCVWAENSCECKETKTTMETIPSVTEPDTCVPAIVQTTPYWDAHEPGWLIQDCSLSGTDPGIEKSQVIDATLRSEIRSLDQFEGASIPRIIGRIVKTAMGMIGAAALIIFLYGGIIWMIARGNATEQEKAFNTIVWAGIGLAVIFASYALVDYVFEAFR